MLGDLNNLELGRLRMSVGYGTHKKGRPLSPIEVGILLRRAQNSGISLAECARIVNLSGTGHINRFIRILKLPEDILHLISWGSGKGVIGFSASFELTGIVDEADQRAVARSILENRLSSKEVRQVAQLRNRSNKSINDCLSEILNMRPQIEKHYIFVGSVTKDDFKDKLGMLTQAERDAMLNSILEDLKITRASGRLGDRFFTLVGDEQFNESLKTFDKTKIESNVMKHIASHLENV